MLIQVRPILFALGLMLCIIAAAMILPAVVDVADGHPGWKVFLASSVLTFFIGGLLILYAYEDRAVRLGVKEGFLLTTVCWTTVTAFAAVPFVGLGMSFTDAYFEAMSGLTTTGSTVIVGLDRLPRGILLWRALLNGMGGLGIIVMAIIMMPFLRIGGMQLFQTESSDKSEKIMPRAFELMLATAGVYWTLMLVCAGFYLMFGMPSFDALCHAMSTLATGGFSTHDASFGHYSSSPALVWTGTIFMALGAMPFVAFIRMARGEPFALWRDGQVRAFVSFLLVVTASLSFWLVMIREVAVMDAIRISAFNVTSIVTTTGFATEDYTQWGTFAIGLFLLLTFVGGCSGSTSGAIKVYRFQVAALLTRSHVLHLISPNRVLTLTYNGRRLPEDVPFSVVAFLALYMTTVGVFTVILSAMGLDLVTALSASAQAIGNVGPGLGEIIGPAGNFATLPAAAKWTLATGMLLGRLELFTVLVLLRPEFWRS